MNSKEVREAIKKVGEEIRAMSDEEFEKLFESSADGDYAKKLLCEWLSSGNMFPRKGERDES